MSENITYFLGAGASANSLPVINELPERLFELSIFLNEQILGQRLEKREGNNLFFTPSPLMPKAPEEAKLMMSKLRDDINWLLLELDNHNTVDTLAKKFYLINERHFDLERLKRVLVTYFVFEQKLKYGSIRKNVAKELPDKRYDSLIATIISPQIGNLSLPNRFKVITWNYDMQFELAFSQYSSGSTLSEVQQSIQAIPSQEWLKNEKEFDRSKFCLVRLNGLAPLKEDIVAVRGIHTAILSLDKGFSELLVAISKMHSSLTSEDLKTFTYSWENPEEYKHTYKAERQTLDIAIDIMRNTKILIIIGYSFPLFNRHVDSELINALPKDLHRVYIQDIKERANDLRNLLTNSFKRFERGEQWLESHIQVIESTNQFFIPPDTDMNWKPRPPVISRVR